jgi:hypothetical protein
MNRVKRLSAFRILAAELEKGHRGGRGRVVGVGQPIDGYLDCVMNQSQHVLINAGPFIADDQDRSPLEGELENRDRVGRLLQPDDLIAFVSQLFQHGGQGAMDFDLQGLGGVSGDLADDLGISAADHPAHPAATCRAGDPRQIHVAPHGRAGNDQFPGLVERRKRFVAFLNEVGHGLGARN